MTPRLGTCAITAVATTGAGRNERVFHVRSRTLSCEAVSIGLLHHNEDLDSRQLIERVELDGESTTLYGPERPSVVRIGRVGMLSETLSGGAAAMYLREIAQHELLAATEEVSLAQRIEASKAAIKELAADPDMDDGQRVELERLVEDGEQAAVA
jgi:hypothetical protein